MAQRPRRTAIGYAIAVGALLALFVTYVLRIPNDGSLNWKSEEEEKLKRQ